MPWIVSSHDEPATRWWMEHVLLAEQRARVADDGSRPLGFAARTGSRLEQLYVRPDHQGQALGRTPTPQHLS